VCHLRFGQEGEPWKDSSPRGGVAQKRMTVRQRLKKKYSRRKDASLAEGKGAQNEHGVVSSPARGEMPVGEKDN